MSDRPAHTRPASHRFRRTLFGYRRAEVDTAIASCDVEISELRRELRYWNDRASYVDAEADRARAAAAEIERAARRRANAIERGAQERSLQLVDRVCAEANAMLVHALREIEAASPTRCVFEPTFGQERAVAAGQQFEHERHDPAAMLGALAADPLASGSATDASAGDG